MKDESLVNHGKLDTLSERSSEVNIDSVTYRDVTAKLLGIALHSFIADIFLEWPVSVVVFETKEGTSGASERKVEHYRPGALRGFDTFAVIHGKEEGVKISESEITMLRD
nr:hypothetical protein L204_03470 [Cryptococcus depauperatus CBS 7855]